MDRKLARLLARAGVPEEIYKMKAEYPDDAIADYLEDLAVSGNPRVTGFGKDDCTHPKVALIEAVRRLRERKPS